MISFREATNDNLVEEIRCPWCRSEDFSIIKDSLKRCNHCKCKIGRKEDGRLYYRVPSSADYIKADLSKWGSFSTN